MPALPARVRLPILAAAFAGGLALGRGTAWGWAALAVAALGAAQVCARRGRLLGVALGWLTGALALGGALGAVTGTPSVRGVPLQVPVWLDAEVAETAVRDGDGVRLVVELAAADGHPASGRVALRILRADGAPPLPGDRLRFRARLRPLRQFANPGVTDPAAGILAARGIAATAWLPSLDVAQRLPGGGRGLWRVAGRIRHALSRAIAPAGAVAEDRGLLAALVVGERAAVTPELEAAFRRAGVVHVLSVSGLHLAAVAFLLYRLARWAAARSRLAAWIAADRIAAAVSAPPIILYTLATGAAPATVRSAAMTLIALTGIVLGRGVHVPTVIAAALVGILATSPGALADPSLQLSFAAVIAIALTARPARAWLDRVLPQPARPGPGAGPPPAALRAKRLLRRLARYALGLTCASAAALLASLPITAYHFGELQPAGVVSNLVVVPLAELVVVPLGLLGAGARALLGTLGAPVLGLALAATRCLLAVVRAFAAISPTVSARAPSLLELGLIYGALLALLLTRGRARRIAAVAAAATLALLVIGPSQAGALAPGATITFLDVGQGDAALVELPGPRRILIDAGGSLDGRGVDPGERAVLPFLRAHGVDHLDLVIASHPHPDHIGGLTAVARELPIGTLWWSGDPTGDPQFPALLTWLRAKGTRVEAPPRSAVLAGATLEVVHPVGPDGQIAYEPALHTNDDSLVVRLGFAGRHVLFAGDVEEKGEALAIAYGDGALAADVLKVPHHGSRTSSSADFLAAVGPRWAVISCGAGNRFGFPAPEVVARLLGAGARVLRTDRDGAVTLEIAPDGTPALSSMRAGRADW